MPDEVFLSHSSTARAPADPKRRVFQFRTGMGGDGNGPRSRIRDQRATHGTASFRRSSRGFLHTRSAIPSHADRERREHRTALASGSRFPGPFLDGGRRASALREGNGDRSRHIGTRLLANRRGPAAHRRARMGRHLRDDSGRGRDGLGLRRRLGGATNCWSTRSAASSRHTGTPRRSTAWWRR